MKPRPALAGTAPSHILGHIFWLSCLATVGLLLMLAVGAFYPKDQTSPSATMALNNSNPPHAIAEDAMSNALMPGDAYHLPPNALLAPLMDDYEPLR